VEDICKIIFEEFDLVWMKRLWDSDEPNVHTDVIESIYIDYPIQSMKEDFSI
jgi:hypothetical protein